MLRARSSWIIVAGVVACGAAWGADPFVGNWKENGAKSKYVNAPAPKSRTVSFALLADGAVKWTSQVVEASGESLNMEYSGKWDGKDIPVTGAGTYDSISVKRTGPRSIQWIVKAKGHIVTSGKSVVSLDGKVLTISYGGKTAEGKPYSVTRVLDRQ